VRLALACLPAAVLLAIQACGGGGSSEEGDLPLPERDAADPADGAVSGSDVASNTDTSSADVDADAKGLGCQGALDCERAVFVTKATYTGQLGGLAGGNAKCQAAADASTVARIKGRTFLAWLGAENDAPGNAATVATRFPHGTKPYVLPNGQKVANDWTDLTDGSLVNGIDIDETAAVIGDPKLAWTGTNNNGSSSNSTCADWTSQGAAQAGQRGNAGGAGTGWTDRDNASCANTHRLYCFEY
jgi:hypothetical protein